MKITFSSLWLKVKPKFNNKFRRILLNEIKINKIMTGIELIAKERQEQIEKHGFDKNHDENHCDGELIDAAVVCASNHVVYYKCEFANSTQFKAMQMPYWELPVRYKGNVLIDNDKSAKEERIHQLKVAGALIAAEIDRLQNLEK